MGAVCLALGLVIYGVCLFAAVPVGMWFLASAVCGLGMGTAYSPLSVVALECAEPGREGAATSALQLNDILGVALGTGMAVVIVTVGDRAGAERLTSMATVFLVAATMAVVVALLSGRLSGPMPLRSTALNPSTAPS